MSVFRSANGGGFLNSTALERAEVKLLTRLQELDRDRSFGRYVRGYSKLGEHAAVWLLIGLIGWIFDRKNRHQWRRGVTATITGYLINIALKFVFKRKRPQLEELPQLVTTPTQLSFPSAHSTSSFVAAAVYGPLLRKDLLYLAASSMALSRLYLGVHYPSDIAAGALLGTAVGSAANRATA